MVRLSPHFGQTSPSEITYSSTSFFKPESISSRTPDFLGVFLWALTEISFCCFNSSIASSCPVINRCICPSICVFSEEEPKSFFRAWSNACIIFSIWICCFLICSCCLESFSCWVAIRWFFSSRSFLNCSNSRCKSMVLFLMFARKSIPYFSMFCLKKKRIREGKSAENIRFFGTFIGEMTGVKNSSSSLLFLVLYEHIFVWFPVPAVARYNGLIN